MAVRNPVGFGLGLLASTALLGACGSGGQSGATLRLQIRNEGPEPLTQVRIDGSDNLIATKLAPGRNATVYFPGRDEADCVHTVVVTAENMTEYAWDDDVCAMNGLEWRGEGLLAF